MNHTHGDLHEWVRRRVHAAVTDALRADGEAIAALPGLDRLDAHTRDFVRNARRLVLACATGLTAVLEAHRPVTTSTGRRFCRGCGVDHCPTLRRVAELLSVHAVRPAAIDRAEAWRRADAYLRRVHRPSPLGVQEFEHGFVAWPVTASGEPDFLLVIDRHTGRLSCWPNLPLQTLIRRYRAHSPSQVVQPFQRPPEDRRQT